MKKGLSKNNLLQKVKLFAFKPGRLKVARHPSLSMIAMALVFLSATAFFIPSIKKFTVIESKTGKILFVSDLQRADTFSLTYQHSVNNSPVSDVFFIGKDDCIVLKKIVFKSFGAGIPSELEKGQVLNTYRDHIEIDNINRPIPKFLLFVGTISRHVLEIGNREIELFKIAKPQTTIELKVRRVSLYCLLTFSKSFF